MNAGERGLGRDTTILKFCTGLFAEKLILGANVSGQSAEFMAWHGEWLFGLECACFRSFAFWLTCHLAIWDLSGRQRTELKAVGHCLLDGPSPPVGN